MSAWWNDFVDGLLEIPALTWVALGLLIALSVVLLVLYRKNPDKKVYLPIALLGFLALILLFFFSIPKIVPEEGGDSILYTAAFWAVVVCVFGIVALVLLMRRTRWTTRMLATGALCVAMSFLLSCITLYRMPQSGSITPASMLPIIVFAWIYGPVPGLCAGVTHGILQIIQNAYVIHPFQFLLDYIFPFGILAVAGFVKSAKGLPWAVLLAGFARFLVHFFSGYVFFGMYAPAGQHPALYSAGYNISYLGPDTLICLVIVLLPRVQGAFIRLREQARAAA